MAELILGLLERLGSDHTMSSASEYAMMPWRWGQLYNAKHHELFSEVTRLTGNVQAKVSAHGLLHILPDRALVNGGPQSVIVMRPVLRRRQTLSKHELTKFEWQAVVSPVPNNPRGGTKVND